MHYSNAFPRFGVVRSFPPSVLGCFIPLSGFGHTRRNRTDATASTALLCLWYDIPPFRRYAPLSTGTRPAVGWVSPARPLDTTQSFCFVGLFTCQFTTAGCGLYVLRAVQCTWTFTLRRVRSRSKTVAVFPAVRNGMP